MTLAADDVKVDVAPDQPPTQFRLPQSLMEGETGGQSSRFQRKSEELVAALENEHANVRLSLQLDGIVLSRSNSPRTCTLRGALRSRKKVVFFASPNDVFGIPSIRSRVVADEPAK